MSETTASRITTIRRVYLIIALFVALIFCLVLLIQIQMDALIAVRAYVGGEGLWAKAQKDAIRSLEHYAIARDEADFRSYRQFIQVPLGDQKARIELQQTDPDMDIARAGFLQGRNHPVDIEHMITFFLRFQHIAYMSQAIGHWTAGDSLIAELNGVAEALHEEIASGRDKPEAVRAIFTRMDSINRQVTGEEDAFSSTLADASRWANDVSRYLTYAIAFLSAALGVILSWPLITRIRATENTLFESEERWKFALEGSGDGVWDWNPQTDEALFSKRWKEIIGYAEHEFQDTGAAWIGHLHPGDKQRVLSVVQEYFVCQQPIYVVEFRMRCKDNSWKWILARGMLVNRDDDGNPLRMIGTHTDITERKLAEANLRIAATTFDSQESLMVTDADSVILRVNQAFTETTGYTSEEVVGQKPSLLKSGRHDAAFYAAMWETIQRTGTWQGEIWDRRKNGEVYPKSLTISAVKGSDGVVTHYVGSHIDITERKAAEEKIQNLAFYDPLTHLPNRRLLMDRLQQAFASSARSGRNGALMFIDLDNFKTLNDTLGHNMGDLLLQHVAHRLCSCVREGDTVARLGGDEFVVMLEYLSEQPIEAAEQAEVIGEKIIAALNRPYRLATHEYRSTPSIGVSLFSNHGQSQEELLKQADIAMYQAKKAGRNTLRFFNPQMQDIINARATFEEELRRALERRQFQLYYQIQVDSSHQVLGAEALIRWIHPERGLVSPDQFIPLAEETGLILPIGQWVLNMACAQLKAWQIDAYTRDFVLAVNVSAKQFRQFDFVAHVQALVRRHAINPGLLKLEITESMLLENIEDTIATMNALNVIGVQFSLDDFGTGYSSLQYLKRLPLNQIKIDKSFVRDLAIDNSNRAIVRTIIAMAHSLNLSVIAEGVETEEQRQLLLNKGCTHFQGYLFGKPVPVAEFEKLFLQCA